MPKLQANFAEVPDQFVKIPAAIYTFSVVKAPIQPSKNPDTLQKDPNSSNVELEAKVETEGEFKGRNMKRSISTKMLTEIKRLAMSCGIPKEQIEKDGIDTDLLPGRSFRAVVKPNVYKDPTTGVMRENTQLAEFLIPGDAGYSV